jgi:hypothetical protein
MVIVASHGCAGATLLMELFTSLGMYTGFKPGDGPSTRMEWPIRGVKLRHPIPHIIKEGKICRDLPDRIEALKLDVEHIYVTIRSPQPDYTCLPYLYAAEARSYNFNKKWRTEASKKSREERRAMKDSLDRYERRLSRKINRLFHHLGRMNIPHTIISYPDYADDPELAYTKLDFLMKKHDVSYEKFEKVFREVVDPKQVEMAKKHQPWNWGPDGRP